MCIRDRNKTKISRTSGHLHTQTVIFFFLHVAIRNSLRSNKYEDQRVVTFSLRMVHASFLVVVGWYGRLCSNEMVEFVSIPSIARDEIVRMGIFLRGSKRSWWRRSRGHTSWDTKWNQTQQLSANRLENACAKLEISVLFSILPPRPPSKAYWIIVT